jgi:hypothetical protein
MHRIATMALVAAFMGVASSANAGGWLADTFIKPFSPQLAAEADKAHAKLGNPLEHVANIGAGMAADAVVPGSGPALTGALEARRNAK